MKLEELQNEARNDLAIVNLKDSVQESYKHQNIKPKWLEYKTKYNLIINHCKNRSTKECTDKSGNIMVEKIDAKVYADKPFDLKVLKTDLQMYINSDEEILSLQGKIAYYESIIKYIEGVIKSIDNRGWDIRNVLIGRNLKME